MKQFIIVFTFFSFFASSQLSQAQSSDMVTGHETIMVPESIQSLLHQIQLAENNEDWNTYYQLREQLIQAWQQVNPEVAKLYRTVSDGTPDATADGALIGTQRKDNGEAFQNLLEEPLIQENPLWGDDKMIFNGRASDISMDIARNGDIYIAVVGSYAGAATRDSVYVFKSNDGGENWTEWSRDVYASTQTFKQVELMLFDGFPGSSGDSYLLLFYLFDNGWLRVGRTEISTPSFSYYTMVGEAGGGPVTQFSVDRNYPASNYRAVCLYDSSNVIKSIRSEPSSNGTVWQDAVSLGLVGRDLDLCYGLNGATYATFNGFSSGNLYVFENPNTGDPSSWGSSTTLVTGATDTTRRAQVIASRDAAPNNIVAVLFEKQSGTTFDIYQVMRPNGGTWGTMSVWVSTLEAKWPALYSRKVNGNQVFPGVFEQSENENFPPRTIRYKAFDGTNWSTSIQVSDASSDVTGLLKPEVADIDGSTPVFAFVGGNYINVYFDNFSWVPTDVNDGSNSLPEIFSLEQNYPNPFNPSTSIQFRIPENSFVSLKIYNVLGKEVSTLINEEKNAGAYEVNFNASALSSGVYFYKLEAGNFVQTRKMVLMK
jgi:hypothetical protein